MKELLAGTGGRGVRFGRAVASVCLALTISVFPASMAHAAGFALKEQSAAALGNFFAGATAGAEDVTYMFFNPAGLVRHEGHQAAGVLSYIAPRGETTNANNGIPGDLGEAGSGDAAIDAFAPGGYLLWSLTPDLKLGLGVNAPFGLKTEYSPTWAGRYHAVESDMKTVNLNPVLAYRLNDVLSVGIGLQVQYMDVLLSNMVDFGGTDLLASFSGDDWSVGATFGLLAELSPETRVGIGYRSRIRHRLEGGFTLGGAPVSPASADFTAPDSVTAGIYRDLGERWAVMAEAGWTRWSTFDRIQIAGPAGVIGETPAEWEDVLFLAAGVSWKLAEHWKIRAGIGFDQSPIPDSRRTPRITDEDRLGAAIGVEFRSSEAISFNASYGHLFIRDATVNLPDLTASYENSYDVISAQAVLRF